MIVLKQSICFVKKKKSNILIQFFNKVKIFKQFIAKKEYPMSVKMIIFPIQNYQVKYQYRNLFSCLLQEKY